MTDYLYEHLWQVWAVISILCLILELSSGDFFIICFSIGAVFSIIASFLGLGFYWQLFVFAVFSLLSIFFVRPVALRYLHKNESHRKSNADALIGRTGRVTETIHAGNNGYVQIDGDQWKAISQSDVDIPAGTTVRVVHRESTIITVEQV